MKLTSFKAYDVRGRIPDEINEPLAYDIGRAYRGVRQAEESRGRAATSACRARRSRPRSSAGSRTPACDVVDIGLCGTEGVYFATFAEELDGGIMVTASHNPPDYNGMKFVREKSRAHQRRHRP